MAMTETGLQTLRYQEILDRIKKNLFANISPDIDLSEDSAIGIILGTVTDRLAEIHEIASEVYDSQLISKAEGTSLDELVQLNDVYRFVAQTTKGQIEVTGDSGAYLSDTTRIRTAAGDIFNPVGTFVLTPSQCVECTVKVNQLVPVDAASGHDGRYTIAINNVVYAHVLTPTDTEVTLLKALHDAINGGTIAIAELKDDGKTLHIYKDPANILKRTQSMSVAATSYLTFDKVTINATVESEEAGKIGGLAGMLNTLESYPAGIDSVFNRYDLDEGRDIETDDELRQRYLSGLSVTGKGTSDAVLAAVKRVPSVSDALIVENVTETLDNTTGLPAKSFEVIVVGGTEDDIAQAIWDSRPLGIRAVGSYQGTAKDIAGNSHQMSFMRPTPKYVFVKLTYSIFDEESLNVTKAELPNAIKEAIKEYGDILGVGKDVVPNRIYGHVYKNVSGIVVHSITAALAPNQTTIPADSAYTAEKIAIGNGEYSVWESSEYTVTETTH